MFRAFVLYNTAMNANGRRLAVGIMTLMLFRAPCAEPPSREATADANQAREAAAKSNPGDANPAEPAQACALEPNWIPPAPEEREILDIGLGTAGDDPAALRNGRIMRYGGLTGVAAGLLLAGAGTAVVYSNAGSDQDASSIHDGILMIVSGSLVSALSSIVIRAATSTR